MFGWRVGRDGLDAMVQLFVSSSCQLCGAHMSSTHHIPFLFYSALIFFILADLEPSSWHVRNRLSQPCRPSPGLLPLLLCHRRLAQPLQLLCRRHLAPAMASRGELGRRLWPPCPTRPWLPLGMLPPDKKLRPWPLDLLPILACVQTRSSAMVAVRSLRRLVRLTHTERGTGGNNIHTERVHPLNFKKPNEPTSIGIYSIRSNPTDVVFHPNEGSYGSNPPQPTPICNPSSDRRHPRR